MDEIDHIIIHSLRQIGCEIEENSSSLATLEPDVIVHCVSKCIRSIDPSIEVPLSMPSGMAQKYGVTLALAEACTRIGFRGDIGYQTFLYSNNLVELRRILMFLIDTLPKDEPDVVPQAPAMTKREKLEQEMRQSLSRSLNSACKMTPIGNTIEPSQLRFQGCAKFDRRKSFFLQTNPRNIWSTILSNDGSGGGGSDYSNWVRSRSRPPQVGVKPSPSLTSIDSALSTGESSSAMDDSLSEGPPENVDPFEQRRLLIESLKDQILQKQQEREKIVRRIREIEEKRGAGQEILEKLKLQKRVKERTLLVLENPEENVQKLERMIENAHDRMKRLEDQWTEHRTPLAAAIEKINLKKSAQASKTKVIEDEIREMQQKQKLLRSEMHKKSELYATVMDELGKVNQKIDRSAYTDRILEIIGNIRKQKTDIDKILRDTREVQKDINTVTAKVERQFAQTDDLLFGNAKRDETSRRAYKLLVSIHGDCSQLVRSVQETGKIGRDIRDLEDQIENGRAGNTASNLQQVSRDLEQMQSENRKLAEQISQLRRDSQTLH